MKGVNSREKQRFMVIFGDLCTLDDWRMNAFIEMIMQLIQVGYVAGLLQVWAGLMLVELKRKFVGWLIDLKNLLIYVVC